MTIPTQAQIEAAKSNLNQGRGTWADHRTITAAEVGEQWKPDIHGTKSEIWDTAVAHTIERCAQVARDYLLEVDGGVADGCAAAIRALKDRP